MNRYSAEPLILVAFQFIASDAKLLFLFTILSEIHLLESELFRFVSTHLQQNVLKFKLKTPFESDHDLRPLN